MGKLVSSIQLRATIVYSKFELQPKQEFLAGTIKKKKDAYIQSQKSNFWARGKMWVGEA